jgi:hypothetical protein
MPFLLSFYEQDKNIYITKNRIVKAVIGNQTSSYDDFYLHWVNTAMLLKNVKDRSIMFMDPFNINNKIRKTFFPTSVLFALIRYKASIIKHHCLFGTMVFLFSLALLPLYVFYFILKKHFIAKQKTLIRFFR